MSDPTNPERAAKKRAIADLFYDIQEARRGATQLRLTAEMAERSMERLVDRLRALVLTD